MDAPTIITPVVESAPVWLQWLAAALTSIITLLLVPFLHKKAQAAASEAKKLELEATTSAVEQRQVIIGHIWAYVLNGAARIAEKKWPELARLIASGQIQDKAAIKSVLRSWGAELKAEAIAYFKNQGIDVLATVGDEFLDKMIERAANATSPFPGKETAVEVLKAKVSNLLV